MMARETGEQPAAVARTLERMPALEPRMREIGAGARHIGFAGRGTSDNAAVYGRYLAEAVAGMPASLAAPSIATHYDAAPFTAQLAAVAVLVDRLGHRRILVDEELDRLPAELESLVALRQEAATIASRLAARADQVLVTSRGLTYCTALETALKLEETCLRPVRGLSSVDLLHGPAAVLGEGVTVLVVAPPTGRRLPSLRQLVETIRSRGARVVGVGGDTEFAQACDESIAAGIHTGEVLAPLALAVPGQQIAEALALARGLDPDAPRGLTKVTHTDAPAR
jgi:glucosamine--fructose-6-phosphate aminotransferase (isomerizing)